MSIPSATSNPTRRKLRFSSLDELLTDAKQLVEAEQAGKLVRVGNWTLGQTLGHLSTWIDYGFDGVPLRIPFFIRWLLRPLRKMLLNRPMKTGGKIPRVPGGTLATAVIPTAEGWAQFQTAIARLANGAPTRPSPLFGHITHDEWIAQHLRHAELHLSFLRIAE